MNRVDAVLNLDDVLTKLAAERLILADFPAAAEKVDLEWASFDEKRQKIRMAMTIDEDLRYENARNRKTQSHASETQEPLIQMHSFQ